MRRIKKKISKGKVGTDKTEEEKGKEKQSGRRGERRGGCLRMFKKDETKKNWEVKERERSQGKLRKRKAGKRK